LQYFFCIFGSPVRKKKFKKMFKFKRWWWSPMNRGLGLIMVHCGMVALVDGALAVGVVVAGVTEEVTGEVVIEVEEVTEEVTEEVEAAVEEAAINKK
jgi:hypothetical protein